MIRIEIVGETGGDVLEKMAALLRAQSGGAPNEQGLAQTAVAEPQPETPAAVATPAGRPRGRPRKDAVEQPVAAEAPAPVAEPAPPAPPANGGLFAKPAPAAAPAPTVDLFGAPTPAKPPATRDDLRAAMMHYVKEYGMQAAQLDGAAMLGVSVLSDLPDNTPWDDLVVTVQSAIANNPYNRAKAA